MGIPFDFHSFLSDRTDLFLENTVGRWEMFQGDGTNSAETKHVIVNYILYKGAGLCGLRLDFQGEVLLQNILLDTNK